MALRKRCIKITSALLAASWLSGCASLASTAAEPTATVRPSVLECPATGTPPTIELSDDILIRVLVSEIAAQRGAYPLAYDTWTELARCTRDPRAAQRAFEVAASAGYFDQALAATQLWSDIAPGTARPLQLRVALLIRANRIDELDAPLVAMLEASSANIAETLLQLHQFWTADTDKQAVLRLNDRLITRYPQLPEAHFAKAVTLANLEKIDDALKELDIAIRMRPDWEVAALYKLQLQKPEERIAQLKLLTTAHPQTRSYALLLASSYIEAGKFAEARKIYDGMLKRWSNDREVLVNQGLLILQTGDYQEADRLLKQALTQNPPNAGSLRYYLGQSAEMQLKYREALNWYLQVDGENQAKAVPRIARLQAKLGNRQGALLAVDTLPESSAEEQQNKVLARAQVLRELKDYKTAQEVLNQAIAATPSADELLLERSLVADLAGDYVQAEADLRLYLKTHPDDASALNALGYTLANRTDRFSEAATLLDRAIQKEPENPAYIDSLGWLRYRQGRLAEAKDLLARAYARYPDPEVAAHYAEVLWQSGEKARARNILEAARHKNPDDDSLRNVSKKLGL